MVAFVRLLDEMEPATCLELVTPEPQPDQEFDFGLLVDTRDMEYHTRRHPTEEHLYAAPTGGFADYALAESRLRNAPPVTAMTAVVRPPVAKRRT